MLVKLTGYAKVRYTIEVDADSVQDAINQVDCHLQGEPRETLEDMNITDAEMCSEPEYDITEAKFTVHCFDIDYDVEEEDVDHMLGMNPTDEEVEEAIKSVKATLDKEVDVVVECEEDDLEDYIADALSEKTGWLTNYFDYKVIKKE